MKLLIHLALALLLTPTASASTSVLEAVSSNEWSPWSFTGFNLTGVNLQDVLDGGTSIGSYSFVSAHYKLGGGRKFSFRLPFIMQTAGFNFFNQAVSQNADFFLHDPMVGYTDYNLVLLPGEIEVYWEARLYIPMSQSSRQQKKIFTFRNDFIISKIFSKRWELEYWPKLRYHIQSQTTYIDNKGRLRNTVQTELNHWATLWFRATPTTSIGWQFGGEDAWFNKSVIETSATPQRYNNLERHFIKMGPSIKFAGTKWARFILNISNKVPTEGFQNTFSESEVLNFKKEHLELTLLSFISF